MDVERIFDVQARRYGALSSEIKSIRKDIDWGNSVFDAFQSASKRIRSGLISRIMALVSESSKAASDISEILEVLAQDVSTERSLREEQYRVTATYVIIIFLTFGIFLLTAYSISTSFIPLLATAAEAEGPQISPGVRIGGVSPEVIKQSFFRASLIQGFCSGILAGKMQGGKILSGLKYSIIMISIAWMFFTFFGI
ncbi:hypothetical protein AKJ50_01750 [candidate division MSBL1 archaeon SCGC-AAA382A13]|uniref:Type II secretion system protein GspF domain-containing protein n=1 Tax=candidate division MSBL1 archaeon SCGC-AAA382A13 TaxID=1698279 RepID=A0A133VF64_9EURY|nr:hypothetical protein AKJ50_01750 [candidate division MSBL1 archaeon SCGC-AAA382A13]